MNRKWLPYLLLLLIAVAIILIRRSNDNKAINSNKEITSDKKRPGFQRESKRLEYTRHAECRMLCRQISRSEVEEIMLDGKINYRKSDLGDRPCPSYALEGVTQDNQRVRIVFAQCSSAIKVVTVIDLDKDWDCNCPGRDVAHFMNNAMLP